MKLFHFSFILPFPNLFGLLIGVGVPDYLLGYSGSVSLCNIKRGPLNLNSYLQEGPQTVQQWTVWCSDILIELFQFDVSISQHSYMCADKITLHNDFKQYLGLTNCTFSNSIRYVLHSKLTAVRRWRKTALSQIFLHLHGFPLTHLHVQIFVCSLLSV